MYQFGMRTLLVIVSVLLFACSRSHAPLKTSSTSGHEGARVCEPGRDQTCNDDPAISSLHGTCKPDGRCECLAGIEKNAATGRCL
jgi:hypothetical protein